MSLKCGHPEGCWNDDEDDPHCEWCEEVRQIRASLDKLIRHGTSVGWLIEEDDIRHRHDCFGRLLAELKGDESHGAFITNRGVRQGEISVTAGMADVLRKE